MFGAYALVDGIFAMVAGIASYRYFERWWAVLLEGVAGRHWTVDFFLPNITALVLLYFIAAGRSSQAFLRSWQRFSSGV